MISWSGFSECFERPRWQLLDVSDMFVHEERADNLEG